MGNNTIFLKLHYPKLYRLYIEGHRNRINGLIYPDEVLWLDTWEKLAKYPPMPAMHLKEDGMPLNTTGHVFTKEEVLGA